MFRVSSEHEPPVEAQDSRYGMVHFSPMSIHYQYTLFLQVPVTPGLGREDQELSLTRARVGSGYIRNLTESKLIIPGRHLTLLETVGQGEWTSHATRHCVCGYTIAAMHSLFDLQVSLEWCIEDTSLDGMGEQQQNLWL